MNGDSDQQNNAYQQCKDEIPREISKLELSHIFVINTGSGEHEGVGNTVIARVVDSYNGKLFYACESSLMSIKVKVPIVE